MQVDVGFLRGSEPQDRDAKKIHRSYGIGIASQIIIQSEDLSRGAGALKSISLKKCVEQNCVCKSSKRMGSSGPGA